MENKPNKLGMRDIVVGVLLLAFLTLMALLRESRNTPITSDRARLLLRTEAEAQQKPNSCPVISPIFGWPTHSANGKGMAIARWMSDSISTAWIMPEYAITVPLRMMPVSSPANKRNRLPDGACGWECNLIFGYSSKSVIY
jgi:hypothetical protein